MISLGPFLLSKDASNSVVKKPTSELVSKKKHIGLQFSASWCGPCKKFTPLLADAYEHQSSDYESGFEIVFVTSDSDMDEFLAQQDTMPWLAVPQDSPVVDALANEYKVTGIPRLVVVDQEGTILSKDAKNAVLASQTLPTFS